MKVQAKNRRLRWFILFGQFTRIGRISGGGRPLLQEGGPISYEQRPSPSSTPAFIFHPLTLTPETGGADGAVEAGADFLGEDACQQERRDLTL
jgi:hypothetical protein